MDYKKTLLRFIFILFAITIISACDTEVSSEPLRLIGIPPDVLYYDSEFEYEFGASGGDGVYRYRYIQLPLVDENDELEDNPVEMTIEVIDSASAGFILRGIPKLPEGSPEEIGSQNHKYQIELTDGRHTITEDFEFTLGVNKLKFASTLNINEGTVNSFAASNLLAQLKAGSTEVCSDVKDNAYEKREINGVYAYPQVMQVVADANVASRTELFYRIKTDYRESNSEKSKINATSARMDVDYINAERSIVLEPGMKSCVAYVDVLDDIILEDNESLSIEFYKQKGGAVDFSGASAELLIVDNEIKPSYTSKQIVRNYGDKVVVPITISRLVDYPIIINVSVDKERTTADEQDYILEPLNGVVTINPGELGSSYTVNLQDRGDKTISNVDKKITITTDLDALFDVDPYTIEINEWSDSVNIDSEIVGNSANDEDVVDFISDLDGVITTLVRSISSINETTILRSYNKDSSSYGFANEGSFEFSKIGVNVTAKVIVSSDDQAAVILNVDGLFGDIYRGNTDFVVALFEKESGGFFNLVSVKQYGTEGSDIVSGARIFNDTLYVYGKTSGSDFEGAPSFETNNGGEDGFVYALSLNDNTFKWARFIGTSAQDNVVSVDIGNKDLIAFVSTKNSDEDAFVRKISTSNGLNIVDDNPVEINTLREDKPVSARFDSSANGFWLLLDSDADLNFVDQLTSSLSRDVQLLQYASNNENPSPLTYVSDQEDIAKSLEKMPDNLNVILSGETYGELEDAVKKGISGSDVFTAVLDSEGTSRVTKKSLLQFGTPANDFLITVKPISNTKFFVLWSEEFTDPPNKVYRISAFSIDGKKLSRDPE